MKNNFTIENIYGIKNKISKNNNLEWRVIYRIYEKEDNIYEEVYITDGLKDYFKTAYNEEYFIEEFAEQLSVELKIKLIKYDFLSE